MTTDTSTTTAARPDEDDEHDGRDLAQILASITRWASLRRNSG